METQSGGAKSAPQGDAGLGFGSPRPEIQPTKPVVTVRNHGWSEFNSPSPVKLLHSSKIFIEGLNSPQPILHSWTIFNEGLILTSPVKLLHSSKIFNEGLILSSPVKLLHSLTIFNEGLNLPTPVKLLHSLTIFNEGLILPTPFKLLHSSKIFNPTNHHWLDQIVGGWKPRVVVPKVLHKGMQVLDLAYQDQKSSQPSL